MSGFKLQDWILSGFGEYHTTKEVMEEKILPKMLEFTDYCKEFNVPCVVLVCASQKSNGDCSTAMRASVEPLRRVPMDILWPIIVSGTGTTDRSHLEGAMAAEGMKLMLANATDAEIEECTGKTRQEVVEEVRDGHPHHFDAGRALHEALMKLLRP